MTPTNRAHEPKAKSWMDKTGDLWCRTFHDQAMWPVNGRYQCRACLRYTDVAWEQAEPRQEGNANVAKPELATQQQ